MWSPPSALTNNYSQHRQMQQQQQALMPPQQPAPPPPPKLNSPPPAACGRCAVARRVSASSAKSAHALRERVDELLASLLAALEPMVYGTMEEDEDEEEGEEEEEVVEEEEDYRAFEDSVAPFDPPSLGLVGSPTSPLSTPRVRGACSRVLAAARSTRSRRRH